jgi:hypothetical protein
VGSQCAKYLSAIRFSLKSLCNPAEKSGAEVSGSDSLNIF